MPSRADEKVNPLGIHAKRLLVYTRSMRNEFTPVIERDGEWFVAWSPEIPGANGQGRTLEECRENLGAAIQLVLEDRSSAPTPHSLYGFEIFGGFGDGYR
jgi:predicted RNase H-like HicB family nuclease